MLTLSQINKAINATINDAIADTAFSAVKLVADDVSRPITRPSLKIMLERSSGGLFNGKCREKTLTFRIYFFAQDLRKYAADNSKMQDIIEAVLLDGLYIEDAYIPIVSVECEIVDTVLVCSFDLYAIELMPDTDTSEPMDELNYKEEQHA